MSIVVTCACAMTYRLPDRYAGKRCRCRECGGAIKVPREGVEARPKRKREKRAQAQRTTRRVASQERQDIRSEQRALLRAGKIRPVSESMHQLSPLDMSRALEAPEALAPRKRPRPTKDSGPAQEKGRKKDKGRDEKARAEKKPTRSGARADAEAPARQEKVRRKDRRAREESQAQPTKRRRKSKDDQDTQGEKGKKKARKAQKEEKEGKKGRETRSGETQARGKRSGVRSGTRSGVRGREDGERDGARRRDPVKAALIIAAVLCLAVGLTLGVALGGGANRGGGEAAQKLTAALETVQALKAKREWDAARATLAPLLTELDQAGLAAEASKVRSEMRTLDALTQLSAIEDDEARLATLLDYARNPDPAVRLGVTHELRSLSGQPEAQDALAGLARDADPRVAENARQGLIAAGGPQALPFLAQAIADAAATGGKQGEVALQRALELDDPAVVPVLAKALEVRPDAPAATLKAILGRLRELGEPSAKDAVKKLTAHADPEVKKLAEETLADLGG